MTLFAALTDNFDASTRDATKWGASYGTLRQQNGKAGIQSDSGYPGWRSSSAYTLTGSYVFAQVNPAPVAGTGTSAVTSEMLVDSPTGGTRIIIQADTIGDLEWTLLSAQNYRCSPVSPMTSFGASDMA